MNNQYLVRSSQEVADFSDTVSEPKGKLRLFRFIANVCTKLGSE